jgi:protein SCO1/2
MALPGEASVAGASRTARQRRWFLWAALPAAVVLVGVLLALIQSARTSNAPAASAQPAPWTWPGGKRRAPSFSLVDQRGKRVSLAQFRGRPVIVTFIDPLCRNFCPLEAKQLNELVRSLPRRSRPAIVAVSVNVYGNGRSNLLQDVSKWRLAPEWRWAVGRRGQLASVWRRYQIGVLVTTKRIAGVTVHEISHTEATYLIDGRGYERALFLWPFRSADVRAALAELSSSAS